MCLDSQLCGIEQFRVLLGRHTQQFKVPGRMWKGVTQRGGLRDKMPSWLRQHVSAPGVGGANIYARPAGVPP
jgi:hypothetical protein